MPFTRVTLQEGYSEKEINLLSAILHQALTEEFAVPPDDCFQVVEVLSAGRFIYDRHYLSRNRSHKFVLFNIVAGRPRTREQKQHFYRSLSQKLSAQLNIPPDNIMVIIQFNQVEDWSFSGGKMYDPEVL